jgi:hypothetical protein
LPKAPPFFTRAHLVEQGHFLLLQNLIATCYILKETNRKCYLMKQALIIIDMQEIFFNYPQNYLFNNEQLVININELIKQAHEKNL